MSRNRLRAVRHVVVAVLLVGALIAGAGSPVDAHRGKGRGHRPQVTVLQEGLSSPRGLASFLGVVPIVGQGAFGPPGPVVASIWPGHLLPVSETMGFVDVALSSDHALWGLESGTGQLFRKKDGGFEHVADIPAYQQTDPDPFDLEDNPTESNPYGLAALHDGSVLVADAAGNDVLRVDRHGNITTVARFGVEEVSTDHLPDFPGPPALPTESVPTSIAVTRHGIYVGELKGFPFRPGSSNIYKLPLRTQDATCSPTAPNKGCRVVEEDLTAIQDLAIDPWTGSTYVLELAAEGTLAFEAGFETGEFPPAVLLQLDGRRRKELVAGQLSQPGSVTATFGVVHVTDGVFGNGRLVRIGR